MKSPTSKFPKETSLDVISREDRPGTTSLGPTQTTEVDEPQASVLYGKKATCHVGQTSGSVGNLGILIIVSI